jgi:hypothetical protein
MTRVPGIAERAVTITAALVLLMPEALMVTV